MNPQPPPLPLQRTLIDASHILHQNSILDAYGHVSALHPTNPSWYIMSRSVAPALVTSPADLIVYSIDTNEPICDGFGRSEATAQQSFPQQSDFPGSFNLPQGASQPLSSESAPARFTFPPGFRERAIHGEIYRRFPTVHAVVHSHCEDVLPFCVNEDDGDARERLRAVFHIAGFLGHGVPTFDILQYYAATDVKDMLVSTPSLGSALAAHFAVPNRYGIENLLHSVVLMANHGFTAIGESVEQAVYRAVYTGMNARVQTKALVLNAAVGGRVRVWNDDMVRGCARMGVQTVGRPWELWVREVEVNPLYRNEA